MVGGRDGEGLRNDVWRSADGASWESVEAVGDVFSGRVWHQAVVYGGNVWVVGGSSGRDEFWRSDDGANWEAVSVSGDVPRVGNVASGNHRAVVYGGSLWVVSGSDVWRSGDGAVWASVSVSGDVFAVAGGSHQAVAYGGSVWVVGGDVWRSADGGRWDAVDSGGVFVGREHHQVAVHRASLSFVYEAAEIVATVSMVRVSLTGATAPVTLLTIEATGGSGGLRFAMASDVASVASVAVDGVFVATNLLAGGTRATVSVLVTDATPVNRTTVAVTMVFVEALTIAPGAARFVVSPDFTGAVFTLTATGGIGGYVYERAEGDVRVTVDRVSGVVSLTTALAAGDVTAVFVARDEEGDVARFTMGLRVERAAGLVAGDGDVEMFVVGGDSGGNDVWRSRDGRRWVSAAVGGRFSGRADHQAVSYGGSLWVLGGRDRGARNDVWRSRYGIRWTRVTAVGRAFSERWGHQAVAYEGSLWIVGGRDGRGYVNDVWRSADGARWDLVAGWNLAEGSGVFAGRDGHQVVVYGGSLWVVGGFRRFEREPDEEADDPLDGEDAELEEELRRVDEYFNDVWRSKDGVTWVSVTAAGDVFSAREEHRVVAYGGSLWVIGGRDDDGERLNDVWRSADGVTWVSVTVAGDVFSARAGIRRWRMAAAFG